MQRRSPLTSRDENGSVLVFVAIVMVLILGFAALAVDLGNARQRHGNAQVAADGGALAGAYAIHIGSGTGCFAKVNCTAAYYTFQSLGIPVGSSPAWSTASCGAHCSSYVLQDATVRVTSPYPFNGDDGSHYVNVRACWNNKNAFAPVIGFPSTNVCASATAQNTNSVAGPTTSPDPSFDCEGQDNFADASDSPTIFPGPHDPQVKAGTKIGAVFHSNDSSLDLGSIDFEAPNAAGQMVTLGYNPDGTHGYSLQPPPPADGSPYPDQTDVKISYKVPSSVPKGTVYEAKLNVRQIAQDPLKGPECGKAAWTFTADGKGVPGTSGCGENSFIDSVYPSNGLTAPGEHIGAIYTDESPLQDEQWSDAFPFGIKFTLSGPGWDDANGNPTLLTPVTGTGQYHYTLTDLGPHALKEKFNTRIDFQLPDASQFYAGSLYTASLTAYDTDQNKPGNDCGHAVWTFTVPGGTAGFIRLVE